MLKMNKIQHDFATDPDWNLEILGFSKFSKFSEFHRQFSNGWVSIRGFLNILSKVHSSESACDQLNWKEKNCLRSKSIIMDGKTNQTIRLNRAKMSAPLAKKRPCSILLVRSWLNLYENIYISIQSNWRYWLQLNTRWRRSKQIK